MGKTIDNILGRIERFGETRMMRVIYYGSMKDYKEKNSPKETSYNDSNALYYKKKKTA